MSNDLRLLLSDPCLELREYWDQQFGGNNDEQEKLLKESSTLYAQNAMWCLNGTHLDDSVIHTDWDLGFREGRQYGCHRRGGQVRDEFHEDFNTGRGGFGEACYSRGIH
ncbi:nuclear cap-binding protein subunit 2-like isoform X2 [Hyaena hyaena]|uniref:nuclear cap-binding protein subunit 2-like isoform X2 n=1 Tax=Hyaena hyaena TaxID=95912 RepID=UPI001923851B|nr:nuclear cap-binding protein subunit 2-like isoform X2 [Hyaena hyaena]